MHALESRLTRTLRRLTSFAKNPPDADGVEELNIGENKVSTDAHFHYGLTKKVRFIGKFSS